LKLKIMNKMIKNISGLLLGICMAGSAMAGNPDRVGQAGSQQLVVNPWSRSAGWQGAGLAGVSGVEAMQFNIAGLVNIHQTEFLASRSNWLGGSAVGININSFGIAQLIGKDKDDALGISITSWDFGNNDITTVNSPEPILGTYTISMVNIALGYSHRFSNSIRGGALIRAISEGIPTVSAQGIALDAGIQYVTGKKDRIKFGVSLRNVGPAMNFTGGGLSTRGVINGSDYSMTLQNRVNEFELPSMLNIGASYDFFLDSGSTHILTVAGAFVSNAFDKDQETLGLQYSFKRILSLRAGYAYEDQMFNIDTRTKAYLGPAAGVSVDIPFGKDRLKRFGVDYAYRQSTFTGTHTFGVRLTL
jgi:hypothetical protein